MQDHKVTVKPTGEAERIVARNNFYIDGWRIMLGSLPVLVVALLISIIFNIILVIRQPEPRYFATHEGRIIPIAPLNVPYVDERFIVQWTSEAVSSIYAMDFMNYRKQFSEMRKFFTEQGYREFENALTPRVQAITEGKLVSSGVVRATPVIVGTGVANGIFVWKVRVPVIVTFSNNMQRKTSNYMLTIVISRVQTYESPYGIAISQIVESPYSES